MKTWYAYMVTMVKKVKREYYEYLGELYLDNYAKDEFETSGCGYITTYDMSDLKDRLYSHACIDKVGDGLYKIEESFYNFIKKDLVSNEIISDNTSCPFNILCERLVAYGLLTSISLDIVERCFE